MRAYKRASQAPLTARPMRQITPLDQGAALMDGSGPFAMQMAQQEQAMMAQQQARAEQQAMMEQEEANSAEEQMLEMLKSQKDELSKSNRVKQLVLSIEDEIAKQVELDARMAESPTAMERLRQLLEGM